MRSRELAVVCAGIAAAACGDTGAGPQPFDVVLPPPVTVVSLESERIAQPSDLAVAPDGRLWIADGQAKQVVSVAPDGTDARVLGREGEGPGEFRAPVAIAAGADRIRVLDAMNGRVDDFTLGGEFLADHRVVAPLYYGTVAIDLEGRVVAPSIGRDSALATISLLSDTAATIRLGPAVAETPAIFDMLAMKNQIANGGVPPMLRNAVVPVLGPGGTVWLLLQGEAEIRRYDDGGRLEWSRPLDVPEAVRAREEFFRRNAEDTNPARIFGLVTMVDGVVADGRLWVLMRGEGDAPAVFYVFDAGTGDRLGRVTVSVPAPVTGFAIDPERNRIFLAIGEEASILAADLSAVPR